MCETCCTFFDGPPRLYIVNIRRLACIKTGQTPKIIIQTKNQYLAKKKTKKNEPLANNQAQHALLHRLRRRCCRQPPRPPARRCPHPGLRHTQDDCGGQVVFRPLRGRGLHPDSVGGGRGVRHRDGAKRVPRHDWNTGRGGQVFAM